MQMTINSRYQHIVIEGPIGAGKTSLAKKLALHLHAQTLFEAPEHNPFLPHFYEDPARYALATQLFFLTQRIHQIRNCHSLKETSECLVGDYLLEKDQLFAELTLSASEFKLYKTLWDEMKPVIPTPDLIILLQAPADILAGRIAKRQISSETGIGIDYLQELNEAYDRFFHHYDAAPVLIVNAAHFNPIDNQEDFSLLLRHIENMKGRREFFNKQP